MMSNIVAGFIPPVIPLYITRFRVMANKICYNFICSAGKPLFKSLTVPTITISRQLGSQGDEVAKAVADRLHYRVVSRDLINQAASQAGAPEMALATIDDLGLFGLRPTPKVRQAYHQSIQHIMESLAEEGNVVIVGRAGQVILSQRPEVLHVKVIAPKAVRAARLVQAQSISIEAAHAQIEASDRTRRNYLRRYYHVRWDDPELYDLIVNTARLEPVQAACLICQALQQCLQEIDPHAQPS
jgi:cytidylate kinase